MTNAGFVQTGTSAVPLDTKQVQQREHRPNFRLFDLDDFAKEWNVKDFMAALGEQLVCPVAAASGAEDWFRAVKESGCSYVAYLELVGCQGYGVGTLHKEAMEMLPRYVPESLSQRLPNNMGRSQYSLPQIEAAEVMRRIPATMYPKYVELRTVHKKGRQYALEQVLRKTGRNVRPAGVQLAFEQ